MNRMAGLYCIPVLVTTVPKMDFALLLLIRIGLIFSCYFFSSKLTTYLFMIIVHGTETRE